MSCRSDRWSRHRRIATAVVGALFVGSCASDDGDDAASVVAEAASTSTSTEPSGSTESIEPAEWARDVATAWSELLQSRAVAASAAIAASGAGVGRVERTQQLYDAEIASFDAFGSALPEPIGDPTLDEPLDALVTAAEAVRDAAATGRDLGAIDSQGTQAELDEAGDAGLPDTEYGAAYIGYTELEGPLIDACFALQDAMISSDLEFVDCTGSSVDTEAATGTATEGLDPTATPTGSATYVDLEPGDHVFDVFEAGLTVETTERVLVSTSVDHVGFRPVDGASIDVVVTDVGGVVVPDSLDADPGLQAYTDSLPDDIASWLAELPVDVVDEGTIDVGGAEVPFWEVEASDAVDGEFLSLAFFDGSPEAGSFASVGLPPLPGARLTLVEWTRRDDRLLIHWLSESEPGPREFVESSLFVETVLSSIVPDTSTGTIPTLSEASGRRSGAGSLIEPGTYRSADPQPAAEYVLETEVSALLTPSLVAFGPPGVSVFRDPTLTVFRLAGVPIEDNVATFTPTSSAPVDPIDGSDDLTAYFSETPGLVLLDSGRDETVTWWDVTTEPEGDGFECDWGGNCLNIVAGAGHGYFVVGNEWTVRIWRFNEGDADSAHVWLQAPSDDFEAALEWALPIVDGISID